MQARASTLRALMIAAIGSVAAIGWPAVSLGQQAPIVRSIRLYIGDLHPDKPADAAILYTRIRAAAQAACGEPLLPESHFVDPQYRQCVEAAVRAAVAQVDSPMLSSYYHRQPSRGRRS
jgi:UrcA family protein